MDNCDTRKIFCVCSKNTQCFYEYFCDEKFLIFNF